MRSRAFAPVLSFTAVLLLAGSMSTLASSVWAPAPARAADVPVSVIIPGPSTTPTPTSTPTPTPRPSISSPASGGGSGDGAGGTGDGSAGGGGATGCGPGGTNSDGSPVPNAQPKENASALQIDRESISIGEWMLSTATGFAPAEKVQFVLYPGAVVIGSFEADATGTAIARFRIPVDTQSGEKILEATNWSCGKVQNEQFLVVSPVGTSTTLWLWWVVVVLGAVLISLIAVAFHYRESIRGWFGASAPLAGSAP